MNKHIGSGATDNAGTLFCASAGTASGASSSKPKATRQAFGEALARLGEEFKEIVVLEADLGKSTKSELFGKKFPNRYFQMGIAEANMVGTGSGLALCGHTVFLCSFGCFVTGRYDTIRMSVAYAQANVRIVGSHGGLGIGDDGHSQMGLEDLSLMRELPTMTVLSPCDEIETYQMMEFLVKTYKGPAYLRVTRQALAPVHRGDYFFQVGKLDVLRRAGAQGKGGIGMGANACSGVETDVCAGVGTKGGRGSRVALLATGAGVQECLGAYELLKAKGIEVTVVNVPTIKPFDVAGVRELIKQGHQKIITVEDHYVIGGLGSAVAEAIAESGLSSMAQLFRLGVQDRFGESGEPAELYEKYGFSANKIAAKVCEVS